MRPRSPARLCGAVRRAAGPYGAADPATGRDRAGWMSAEKIAAHASDVLPMPKDHRERYLSEPGWTPRARLATCPAPVNEPAATTGRAM